MIRKLACICGLLAAIPAGVLAGLALITPITPWGALYLLGFVLLAAGALSAPWRRRRYRGLARAGLALLVLTAVARLAFAAGGPTTTMLTLPGPGGPRWINRLLDEQDVTLFAERVLTPWGLITPREDQDLLPALYAAYQAMRAAEGSPPSPFLSTYLGRERPQTFDALVVEPGTPRPAQVGLIFLHGFAGNYTMPCWLLAQAARPIGAVTVCPSVGWRGDWWTADGEATVRATLSYLHSRGVRRVYLAGLSNGAVGASALASRLQGDLAGLVLISGSDPDADLSDLPTLIVQGSDDERMPAALAQRFAQRAGAHATYIELPGDHFVLVERADELRQQISAWFERVEAGDARSAPRPHYSTSK
jgi:pimeloyl-ACP methyl ester carboxylesterase